MVKTYQVWIDKDEDGNMVSSGTVEQMEDQRSKGLLGAKPRLLFTIQAETYEEALAVRNIKLGWSPYFPNGKPADCPTCGAIFYPNGYGECPNCGPVSPNLWPPITDVQEGNEESSVHPVIKFIENTDTPILSLSAYRPDDPTDFACTLGMTIGPADDQAGHQFYLTVCSPKWLARTCEKDGFVWGRHHLIVREYNLNTITGIVTRFVEQHSGESWKEVAMKLGRFTSWGFEDYQKK